MICHECQTESVSGIRCDCDVLRCPTCIVRHVCPSSILPLWTHQAKGIDDSLAAEKAGHRAICVTSPTGGGKRRMIVELAKLSSRAVIFTNRKMLTKQTDDEMKSHGIDFGVMAAGYEAAVMKSVQVASVQTINSRVFEKEKWQLPLADRVFFDEAHSRAYDHVIKKYLEETRAVVYGFTATPVGIGDLYKHLITAGTKAELRKCGALVQCDVFAPSEPDMKGVKRTKVGEYYQKEMAKRVMMYQWEVFGDVIKHWKLLNPFMAPTLLFAPGVKESIWFVEQFKAVGISAAHIDALTTEEERDEIKEGSKNGGIKIVCSYGVLREGADWPWIHHGILLQVCGCLSTYLQIVGRLLRACKGKDRAILQDHSGVWHRHGSPNLDRQWSFSDTDRSIAKEMTKKRQQGDMPEPIRCPECGGIRRTGPKCPHCGHEHVRSVRLVRMTDGRLKKMIGNVVKKKEPLSDEQRVWTSCLFAAARSGRTVTNAAGAFVQKTGRRVPQGLKYMPSMGSVDWQRKVRDVFPWMNKPRRKVSA